MTKTSLIEHTGHLGASDRLGLIGAICESLEPNDLLGTRYVSSTLR